MRSSSIYIYLYQGCVRAEDNSKASGGSSFGECRPAPRGGVGAGAGGRGGNAFVNGNVHVGRDEQPPEVYYSLERCYFILILFRFYSDFILKFRFYSDYILILFWIYSGSDRGDAHFSHNILLTFTLAENGVKQPSSLFPGPAPPIRLVFISAENWVKMTGRVIGFRAAARRCGESTVMAGGICTDPPANRFASLNAPQRAPKRHLGPPTSKRTRKNAYRYRDHEM